MITEYKYKNITWVDALSPTQSEIKKLMREYGINPRVAEELIEPTLRPKLDVYKNYLYLILHFPAIRHTHSNEQNQEVDFIIAKNFLLTVRYDTIDALHKFAKEFEVSAIIDRAAVTKHAGYIFSYMMRELYTSLSNELAYIESTMGKIEDNIFKGQEKAMVEALSRVSRALLDIKQTVLYHGEMLSLLELPSKKFFGISFADELKAVARQYRDVMKIVSSAREFLTELRGTNNSLLSTKQNEVMKVLTIMAFVTFPLSLIASIFGMNTKTLPLVGFTGDFWIVIGIMAMLTGIFFWYFKHRKWL